MPRFERCRPPLLILALALGGCTSVERASSPAEEVGRLEDALREKDISLVAAHESVQTLLARIEELECRTEELAKEKRSLELVRHGLGDRIRHLEAENRKLLASLDESEKHYSRLRLSYDTLRKLNDAYSDKLDALHADYVAMKRAYQEALDDAAGDSPKIQKIARRKDELVPVELTPRQAARLERLERLRDRLIAEASGEGAVHRFSPDTHRAGDNDLLIYHDDPAGLWKELAGFLGDRFGSLFRGGARWDTVDGMLFSAAIATLALLIWLIGAPVRWLLRKKTDRELQMLRRRVRELEALRSTERSRGRAQLRLARRHPGFFEEARPEAAIARDESPSRLHHATEGNGAETARETSVEPLAEPGPVSTSARESVILDGGIWKPWPSPHGARPTVSEEEPPETAKTATPEEKGRDASGTEGALHDVVEPASCERSAAGPAERSSPTGHIEPTQIIPDNLQEVEGEKGESPRGNPPAEEARETAPSGPVDVELADMDRPSTEHSGTVSSLDLPITEKVADSFEKRRRTLLGYSEDAGRAFASGAPDGERDDAVPVDQELSGTYDAGEREEENERVTIPEEPLSDPELPARASRKRSRRSTGNTEVLSELSDLIGKSFEPQGK